MKTKIICSGEKFHNKVIQDCIKTRKEMPFFIEYEKLNMQREGDFLQKTATEIEIAISYAFASASQKDQLSDGFKKAIAAIDSYRQGIYHKGGFMLGVNEWCKK